MCDEGDWTINALKKTMENLDLHPDLMEKEKGMCSRLELNNHLKGHQASMICSFSISSFIFLDLII